jgi:flagellar biosynthesis protein FliQ
MSDAQVLQIVVQALEVGTKLAAPALLAALVIGTAISVIQTVTQVQEMSLSFVPKLIGVAAVMLFAGNWMMREIVGWVTSLWNSIPSLV